MHRTKHVLRLIGWWSLLIGVMLYVGANAASTQEIQTIQMKQGPNDKLDVPVILMTVGTTQTYRTTSKENLKRVENPNNKVLNVSRVATKFDEILFEAVGPGRTRVTLIDQKDRVELVDVIVVTDRVKELRDMLQRSVPTGSISVTSTDSGNNIILNGTVLSTDDAKIVQQIAGQLFGSNVINNVHIGGVQQVQLEVVIATVNRSEVRNMAFSFMLNSDKSFVASILTPGALTSSIVTAAAGGNSSFTSTGGNVPFGVLGNTHSFFGFLQALRTESLSKILAEPRLVTLSGRPAKIQSGGNVQIISGGTSSASLSADFGTIVTFLPVVLGNGKIHLEVAAELSTPTTTIPIPGAGAAGSTVVSFSVLKRSAQVAVQVEDGQTLMIGGLIQNNVDSTISRVPVLGDLPFVGTYFSSKEYNESEEEFIVLVTPRLVDPFDCTKFPKYLPGRETRVPDDFEFFLEGIMEAPHGQRNISLLHYKGAHMSTENLGQFPCNDVSGCYHRGGNNSGGCANGACNAPGTYPIIYGDGANGTNNTNGTYNTNNTNGGNGTNGANGTKGTNGGNGTYNTNGGNGGSAPMIVPAPQSRPGTPMPAISNIRYQPQQQEIPMPPVREPAPNLGPSFPAPMPSPAAMPPLSSMPPRSTTPIAAMPALSAMPPLPSIPMSAARELDNRPVLPPPVSFGPASVDEDKSR